MESLKYSEIIKQNSILAKELVGNSLYRIKILSNVTCNQLKDVLAHNLMKSNINPDIQIGNYDNIIQDSYNCTSFQLVIIHYDLLNVIEKDNQFIEDYTDDQINALYQSIISDIDQILINLKLLPTVVFDTFSASSIYQNAVCSLKVERLVKQLNEYLYSKKETILNLNILDINITLTRVGIANAFDFRMYYLSKTLYSITFWKEYVYELSTIIYKYTGKIKKAIIFDCDNTLWKGILGEDGISGIDMSLESKVGQIFNKIQQIAVWLSKQGVIIGLCSKNNSSDVDQVLNEHTDMILKKDYIVVSKVNWQDKASNLKEIAKELNIGLDSFVFVDDSPFEVSLIEEQLPDVLTLLVPKSIQEYPAQFLTLIERNFYFSGTISDIEKTKQYKAQFERLENMSKHKSLDDYLSSLNMEIKIIEDDITQIPRISQLTQKTNQFNLTTQRYTENQIQQFMNNENDFVFSVSVKDKFGESGLSAICIIHGDNETAIIDSLLMSCRIMGRNIEYAFLSFIIDTLKEKGYKVLNASWIMTNKNVPVKEFYDMSGFLPVKIADDIKLYTLTISDYKRSQIDYIKINN